jgi:hypothetical protein
MIGFAGWNEEIGKMGENGKMGRIGMIILNLICYIG